MTPFCGCLRALLEDEELPLAPERAAFPRLSLTFDEQADQIFAMSDPIANASAKSAARPIKSIGHIARLQRVLDNDVRLHRSGGYGSQNCVRTTSSGGAAARSAQRLRMSTRDFATSSLIEIWIDETEGGRGFYSGEPACDDGRH